MPVKRNNRKRINPDDHTVQTSVAEPKNQSFLKRFFKVNEYLLGIGILCYLLGFIIENIYLGSFGVTNFDVLRVRYILIGGFFVAFLLSVGIPVYDLILHYYRQDHGSFPKILWRLIWNGILLSGILTILGGVYDILAGTYHQIPVGVPILNPPVPIMSWLVAAIPEIFTGTLRLLFNLLLILIVLIGLITLIVLLFNPKKNKKRVPRKETLRDIVAIFNRKSIISAAWFILLVYIVLFLLGSSYSLAIFMVSSQIRSSVFTSFFHFSSVYQRFFLASGVAYLTISCTFLLIILRWEINEDLVIASQVSKPLSTFTGWIYIAALIISAILPIYTFGVYPSIPQQIGGGLVIPVTLATENKIIQSQITSIPYSQFLLDRTGNSALLLCIDPQTKKYHVFEIPSDQISSIEYRDSP